MVRRRSKAAIRAGTVLAAVVSCCVLILVVLQVTPRAWASAETIQVRAVGADGAGIADAHLACADPPADAVVADRTGRAELPASCRRITCRAPGRLAASVTPAGADVSCVLRPGVVVSGAVPAAACASGCVIRLSADPPDSQRPVGSPGSPAPADPPGSQVRSVPPGSQVRTEPPGSQVRGGVSDADGTLAIVRSPGDANARFAFDAQPPGDYRLEITRAADRWRCGVRLGLLSPGATSVDVTWREPAALRVRVEDEEGQPRPGVRVRAWSRLRGAGPRDPEPVGTWTCAGPTPPDDASGQGGAAQLRPLDPGQEHLLVAGGWDATSGIDVRIVPGTDPRVVPGTDARVVPVTPQEPVVLTPRPTARVRGRVLDDADRPVKGNVELTPWGESAAPWLARVLPPLKLEDVLGPRGVFGFEPALPGRYQVAVRGPEVLPLETATFTLAPGGLHDLGVLRVPTGERFVVQVRDEQHDAVAGAEIVVDGESGLVVRRRATTDADGIATVAALPPGSRIQLLATADGYAPHHVRGLEARQSPYVVELRRGAIVAGRVVDPWDAPVAGAAVSFTAPKDAAYAGDVRPRPVITGADGSFTLAQLPPGEVVLTARAPRFASPDPLRLTTAAGETRRGVVLRLGPPRDVRGRVLDPSGRGVEGARVLTRLWYTVASALDDPAVAETRSGPDGGFELPCTSCTDLALVALAPGYAGASRRIEDPAEPQDLQLARGARLVIRGPAPRPGLQGAAVEDGAGIRRVTALDAQGRGELEDLAPGEGSAVLLSAGWNKTVPLSLASGATAEVELSLADSAIEGRVTVEGQPWPGAVIGARHSSPDEPYAVAIAHAGGGYDLALPPGEIVVSARAGGGSAGRRIVLHEGERQIVDLDITRVTAEVFVVAEDDGAPVDQASVSAAALSPVPGCGGGAAWQSADEEHPGFHASGVSCSGSGGATAGDGRGVLRFAAPGSYAFTVRAAGFEPFTRTIQLQAGNNPVRLAIRRSGRALRIKLPEGTAASVFCRRGETPLESRALGEEPVCRAVPEGPVEAFVCVPGIGISRAVATLPAQGEVVVEVVPRPGGRLVVPTSSSEPPSIVDAAGVDWAAPVFITCRPERPRVQVPETGWSWVFDGLPAGTYVVTVDGVTRPPVDVVPGGRVVAAAAP